MSARPTSYARSPRWQVARRPMRGTPAYRIFVTVTGSPITCASMGSCTSAAADASNARSSASSVVPPAPAFAKGVGGGFEAVIPSTPSVVHRHGLTLEGLELGVLDVQVDSGKNVVDVVGVRPVVPPRSPQRPRRTKLGNDAAAQGSREEWAARARRAHRAARGHRTGARRRRRG